MRIPATIAALLLLAALGAEPARATERYYTFMGLTGGFGVDQVSYSGWVVDSQKNLDLSGSYYSAGLVACAVIRQVIGEFTLQYMSNSISGDDVDASVSHMYLSIAGKYFYTLSPAFHLTAGLGLYGDAPPATLEYEGGGGLLALAGVMVNLTFDLRLMADVIGRYGSFGLGEGSTKISYGAALSVVYNVGRI